MTSVLKKAYGCGHDVQKNYKQWGKAIEKIRETTVK